MGDQKSSTSPRWILIGTGVAGLAAALLVLVTRYYELQRARAEAAQAEAAAQAGPADPSATHPQPPSVETGEQSALPLFNGRDLTGWKTHPAQPGGWTVEDGYLTGRSTTANHLFSEAGDYGDFHLWAECRTNRFGNSGIYFRTPFAIERPATIPKYPGGYEAQILHEHPKVSDDLTGGLKVFGKLLAPVTRCNLKPGEWFTLEVIAQGKRIVVKVNGVETANVEDGAYERGYLALQAMSDSYTNTETLVQFRLIEIRRLHIPNEAPTRPGGGG